MARKAIVKGEMDRRIIEQKILHREIGEEELKKALAGLPDLSDQADYVKVPWDEEGRKGGAPHAD